MSGEAFNGRRVVVTGGASGIGAATARQLLAAGAGVCLVDLDGARLKALSSELSDKFDGEVAASVCDVTDETAFVKVCESFRKAGSIDGLVCCAGLPDRPVPAERIELADWHKVIDSQLTSTLVSCKTVGALMLADRGGSIVNIASVLAFNAGPVLAYGAAKAAIVNLTASLAVQWASHGVRVNAVAPGWTDTPFLSAGAQGFNRDFSAILASTPAGRLLQPDEIAAVVLFLLSPCSSAIVGTTVACDGGVLAGAGWHPYGGLPERSGIGEKR